MGQFILRAPFLCVPDSHSLTVEFLFVRGFFIFLPGICWPALQAMMSWSGHLNVFFVMHVKLMLVHWLFGWSSLLGAAIAAMIMCLAIIALWMLTYGFFVAC